MTTSSFYIYTEELYGNHARGTTRAQSHKGSYTLKLTRTNLREVSTLRCGDKGAERCVSERSAVRGASACNNVGNVILAQQSEKTERVNTATQ